MSRMKSERREVVAARKILDYIATFPNNVGALGDLYGLALGMGRGDVDARIIMH